jgi:hypothetical protein
MLAKILGQVDTRLVHRVYAHFTAGDLQADMLRCGFTLKSNAKPEEDSDILSLPTASESTS